MRRWCNPISSHHVRGPVVQSAEPWSCKPATTEHNRPGPPVSYAVVEERPSSPVCLTGNRGFESRQPRQFCASPDAKPQESRLSQTVGLQSRTLRVQVPPLLPKFAGVTQPGQSASPTKRKPVVRIHPPAPGIRRSQVRILPSKPDCKTLWVGNGETWRSGSAPVRL